MKNWKQIVVFSLLLLSVIPAALMASELEDKCNVPFNESTYPQSGKDDLKLTPQQQEEFTQNLEKAAKNMEQLGYDSGIMAWALTAMQDSRFALALEGDSVGVKYLSNDEKRAVRYAIFVLFNGTPYAKDVVEDKDGYRALAKNEKLLQEKNFFYIEKDGEKLSVFKWSTYITDYLACKQKPDNWKEYSVAIKKALQFVSGAVAHLAEAPKEAIYQDFQALTH